MVDAVTAALVSILGSDVKKRNRATTCHGARLTGIAAVKAVADAVVGAA